MSSIAVETRIALLENQTKRMVADIESEKDNRVSIHSEIHQTMKQFDDRLRGIERLLYTGLGIIIAANVVLPFLVAYLMK